VHPSFLRIGRQPVIWGEGRLLGEADWTAIGRALDAVRARVVVRDVAVEALGAVLTDPEDGASIDAYGELAGVRFEWFMDPLFSTEIYALGRFAQHDPQASLDGTVKGETYTGALRFFGDSRGWTWGAEGAYQLGRVRELALDRAAWAAAGYVAYAFDGVLLSPTVGAGVSYATGDSGSGAFRTFDPILPDVHRWHGAMDLFAWSNEAEASARVAIVPFPYGRASVEYRYARLAQADAAWRSAYLTTIGRAAGNTDANLGHEIDARVGWSPWDPVSLDVGYSVFFLGGGARAVLLANAIGTIQADGHVTTASLSHFAYAQATLRVP
jgi:hypothetical protein